MSTVWTVTLTCGCTVNIMSTPNLRRPVICKTHDNMVSIRKAERFTV